MMSWINTLRTSAEDLGTLAENEPPTGYEPNDRFITEAYVEYAQESSGEQRFPDDFEYDDATIGKTLLDACQRRADRSEEEGLSSCLSSSNSHDRTVRPHLCRAPKKLRDTLLKANRSGLSWSDKESRFSLTVKQRFENTNSKLSTTEKEFKNCVKRSSRKKEEICRAHQGDERRRQDHQLIHEQLLKQN